MEKEKKQMNESKQSIIIDGVEYITQIQAREMAGVSAPTFRKKVNLFGIERITKASRKVFFRKSDIEDAAKNGWFAKWWV